MQALELLARGDSVTEVALALRYESTSAVIQTFRRHLGMTPARYLLDRPPPETETGDSG